MRGGREHIEPATVMRQIDPPREQRRVCREHAAESGEGNDAEAPPRVAEEEGRSPGPVFRNDP